MTADEIRALNSVMAHTNALNRLVKAVFLILMHENIDVSKYLIALNEEVDELDLTPECQAILSEIIDDVVTAKK